MKTLCIDTAYKYLTCTLIEDDKIISSYSEECFKKQSEEVFNVLNKLFSKSFLYLSKIFVIIFLHFSFE